jgi:hypothetical protein
MVVWDIDDVLNDLTRVWLEKCWRRLHPKCRCSYAELAENPPHRILGVRKKAYLASLDRFRLSGAYARLKPNREILAWFEKSGGGCRHLALSAVPLASAGISCTWLFKHFGRWIRSFHVVPSARAGQRVCGKRETKSEFLARWGRADFFVDDSEENIRSAASAGIRTFLRPQPWNRGSGSVKDMLRKMEASLKEFS